MDGCEAEAESAGTVTIERPGPDGDVGVTIEWTAGAFEGVAPRSSFHRRGHRELLQHQVVGFGQPGGVPAGIRGSVRLM